MVHETMRSVCENFYQLIQAQSVLDLGCMTSEWRQVAHDMSMTIMVGIYDRHLPKKNIAEEKTVFHVCTLEEASFTALAQAHGKFDCALCLEVAQHLDPARVGVFIAELCTLADTIIFSAAIPGQENIHHNGQWPCYWQELFAQQDFACFDPFRLQLWPVVKHWQQAQNTLLFVRKQTKAWQTVSAQMTAVTNPLHLVHPEFISYLRAEKPPNIDKWREMLQGSVFDKDFRMRMLEFKLDDLRAEFAQHADHQCKTVALDRPLTL